MPVTVTDAIDGHRFEAHIDGALAGYAAYRRTEHVVTYPHTVVEPEYEGQGVGGALARAALDDARRRGLRVRATCPFISAWMGRHPEYQDLSEDNPS